jgi:hypothetical protein
MYNDNNTFEVRIIVKEDGSEVLQFRSKRAFNDYSIRPSWTSWTNVQKINESELEENE